MSYWDPKFERGVGGMSAGASSQMQDAGVWLQRNRTALDRVINRQDGMIIDQWFGRISATEALGTRRWRYQLQRVDLVTSMTNVPNYTTALDDAVFQNGTAVRYAYNLYEWQTLALGKQGDGSDPTLLPAGFAYVPIVGIVMVSTVRTYTRDGAGAATAVASINIFERANGIDGTCQ